MADPEENIEHDVPYEALHWVLDKAVGAAKSGVTGLFEKQAGKLVDKGIGWYISLFGLSDGGAKDPLAEIHGTLVELDRQLHEVVGRIDRLEGELFVAALGIEDHANLAELRELRVDIVDEAFNSLKSQIKAGDPDGVTWANKVLGSWYFGHDNLHRKLQSLHSLVTGRESEKDEGILTVYEKLLAQSLRNASSDGETRLSDAYKTLERRFLDALSIQFTGCFLFVLALLWRDIRKNGKMGDPAEWVSVFSGSAADYLRDEFGPNIAVQVDDFLQCVDRLVITSFSPRSIIRAPYVTTAESWCLNPRAREIYRSADLLAASVSPENHGYEVVARLVGDPAYVRSAMMSFKPSLPDRYPGGTYSYLSMPTQAEPVAVAGAKVNVYGPLDLKLAAADFPAGNYIEWTYQDRGWRAAPQNTVAVAKWGIRRLLSPKDDRWADSCTDGKPAAAFLATIKTDNSSDAQNVQDLTTSMAETLRFGPVFHARVDEGKPLDLGPQRIGARRFGHMTLVVHDMPCLSPRAMNPMPVADWKKEAGFDFGQQYKTSVFDHMYLQYSRYEELRVAEETERRELLSFSCPAMPGMEYRARYSIAYFAEYADTGKAPGKLRVATSPDKAFALKFRAGTDECIKTGFLPGARDWLEGRVESVASGPWTDRKLISAAEFRPVTLSASHSRPTAVCLDIHHVNDTPCYTGMISLESHEYNLDKLYYWIEDIELTLGPATKK